MTGIYSTLIYYNRLPGPNVGFRAYGERLNITSGLYMDKDIAGLFDIELDVSSHDSGTGTIGFRAYGERLIGRNSRSVTASGIFDIELNSRREVNTQERGFRASWVRNYGERLRISGYEFTGGVLAGIFMSVPSSNRLTSEYGIGFRAICEELW